MSYLQAVPNCYERESAARPVTVVSADSRDVVYLEDAASLEIITAALRAWGLKVRAERAPSIFLRTTMDSGRLKIRQMPRLSAMATCLSPGKMKSSIVCASPLRMDA